MGFSIDASRRKVERLVALHDAASRVLALCAARLCLRRRRRGRRRRRVAVEGVGASLGAGRVLVILMTESLMIILKSVELNSDA